MATNRKKKASALDQITEELKSAKGAVFAGYRGMTVKDIDKVRKALRKEKVSYTVVKVTLLRKALEAIGVKLSNFKYSGPLAVAISKDEETTPARIIKGLTKDNPKLVIDGGILNAEIVDGKMVEALASLPGKPQLQAQLLSVMAGPARGFVTVLSGNALGLLNVLKAASEKK